MKLYRKGGERRREEEDGRRVEEYAASGAEVNGISVVRVNLVLQEKMM